jgi:predicted  nucleic acid-binding Zn-ribbon protein
MPDQKSDARQHLLNTEKEELVERIEFLQAELQRRMDVEEEQLHANFQRGTASLQSQVEEASRRFQAAQQELEAFRLEVLRSEGDSSAGSPRPYIYEDLSAPPTEGPNRDELRGLLAAFRRLRDDRDRHKRELEQARKELGSETSRAEKAAAELATLGVSVADFQLAQDRLRQEIEEARAEIDRLRQEAERVPVPPPAPETAPAPLAAPARRDPSDVAALRSELSDLEEERDRLEQEKADARADAERVRLELENARDAFGRASEEASSLKAAARDLDQEVERLKREMETLNEQAAAHLGEQAELSRKIAFEQARSEQLGVEKFEAIRRLAETARQLEEARFELDNPAQSVGYEQLEKFLEKIRLKALLEKSVRSPQRKDQPPAPGMLVEIVGATIGAQDRPLEGARNLLPRIQRPQRLPGLGQLRQFIEDLKAGEVAGVRKVHELLRASFFATAKRSDLWTVDLDTLELVVDQRPRPSQSYWPLVLFVPELQEFWHGELRTESENKPKEIADFLAEALSRAPATLEKSKIQVRMDARFYSDAARRVLESRKCGYVAGVPDSAEIRAAARACAYLDAGDGWEAGEWTVKKGTALVRFVALRHPRSAAPSPQMPAVFKDPQHAYQVFAVDRKISPRQALEAFSAREASEAREHALLRDVAVNRLLARGSAAHAAFLPLFLLSADLLQWYRRGLK